MTTFNGRNYRYVMAKVYDNNCEQDMLRMKSDIRDLRIPGATLAQGKDKTRTILYVYCRAGYMDVVETATRLGFEHATVA